jgi:hypothetical protein
MIEMSRRELLQQAAQKGKYAPLYNYLGKRRDLEWSVSFAELEAILGFKLPNSARVHRPWWANQGERGGHSHALAWEMAGWKTSQVDMAGERVVFAQR